MKLMLSFLTALYNFKIFVGNVNNSESFESNSECQHEVAAPDTGSQHIVLCEPPLYGQYVIVELQGNGSPLMLCEVDVYGCGCKLSSRLYLLPSMAQYVWI